MALAGGESSCVAAVEILQPAKIEHMKVVDREASLTLSKIFLSTDLDHPLFAASRYQYRKRWDYV